VRGEYIAVLPSGGIFNLPLSAMARTSKLSAGRIATAAGPVYCLSERFREVNRKPAWSLLP
jgi:hypothetical protein